ncbi:MAG: hypothetical protein MUO53_03160 [Maribacter sp.]|nr:hypothetical protein [Maribacter sp.]
MKKIHFYFAVLSLVAFATLSLISCADTSSDLPEPPVPPVITGLSRDSGIIGTLLTIYGNNLVVSPDVEPGQVFDNTNIVKFNGIIAEASHVFQDSIGKQSISVTVPEKASTGKITVTANGITASSRDDFIVTIPMYVPNVTVSTLPHIAGTDVAIDADGNIYIPTNDDFKIYKIAPDGTFVIFVETYNGPNSGQPLGIAVDSDSNVYATIGNKIQKITPDGTRSILAGGDDYGYADGQGTNAKFVIPIGIDVDANGNVYVADALNNAIRKITQPDGMVTTLAGGTEGYADAQGPNAKFNLPMDVAVDATGNVFVIDSGNFKIRKITPSGDVTTVAGNGYGFLDGPGTTAKFADVRCIAVDTGGNVYVGDTGNFLVRRISQAGNVTTVAGSTSGDLDGPGTDAKFSYIGGISLDASGAIYVAQGDLGRTRKIVIN